MQVTDVATGQKPDLSHHHQSAPDESRAPAGPAMAEPPCDGRRLLAALVAASTWLDGHRAAVDALNVFPVPDGDTGTNMAMTLQGALREARSSPSHEAGEIAERAAYGALMGARGNSGVILSQLLRGLARALHGHRRIGPAELAAAFALASETAARAVIKPVEGTILTVARAAAGAAEAAVAQGLDMAGIFEAVLDETRAAVARTPDQLPILKQAGVVDAGAQGYLMIVEGAVRYLKGQDLTVAASSEAAGSLHRAQVSHAEDYGYCTELVIVGPQLDESAIRADIAALGDSTLVVGEEGIVRVHVHTDDPGRILSYAAPLGRLHRIKIESMQDQHDRFVAETTPSPVAAAPPQPALPAAPPAEGEVGVVAVAPGEGLARVFRSLGAGAVVTGGQTMNPSTEELLAAVVSLPQDTAVVLPNNGNVVLVAQQARDHAPKKVAVVPSRTVPQGIAALLAYIPTATLEENATAMEDAAASVHTGEITVAVRDAQLDGLAVRAGEVLGLLDGRAVASGSDREAVTLELIERMRAAGGEILTIYYGSDSGEAEAQSLARRAGQCWPELEIEVVDGGQPYYPYILSLE
jgi:DAK2 domain fusion protein YloV